MRDAHHPEGPKTWRECADAGMSLTAAARHMGKTVSAGSIYAKRHGFVFPKDPEFAERHREASRERMRALHADPEFAERNRERMRALHADPEFAERHRERMRALHADPEFAERNREASRERMRARHADPEFNPLSALTPSERADYDTLVKRGGYKRNDALKAIGRDDLVLEGRP